MVYNGSCYRKQKQTTETPFAFVCERIKLPLAVTLSSDSGLRNFLETYFYASSAGKNGEELVTKLGTLIACLISLLWMTRIDS